jgi:hypothetical protein
LIGRFVVNLEMVFGLGPCGFYLGHRLQYRNQTLPTLTMHEAPRFVPIRWIRVKAKRDERKRARARRQGHVRLKHSTPRPPIRASGKATPRARRTTRSNGTYEFMTLLVLAKLSIGRYVQDHHPTYSLSSRYKRFALAFALALVVL